MRIAQPKGDNDPPSIKSICDFPSQVRRRVGIFREHKDHHSRGADRVPNRLRPIFTWRNVARCNPASHVGRFKLPADCVRDLLILTCVTYKDIVGHRNVISCSVIRVLKFKKIIHKRACLVPENILRTRILQDNRAKKLDAMRFLQVLVSWAYGTHQ